MFERFLENSLNTIRVKGLTDIELNQYEGKVPNDLIKLWKEVGFGIFCDGLLRIVPPTDYLGIIDDVYYRDYNISLIPFLVTAFGDVFVYIKNKQIDDHIVFFNMRYGTFQIFTKDLSFLFNILIVNKSSLRLNFKLDSFQQIKKALGMPGYDECFAYVPALVLGGKDDIKNIQIMKTLPYINIITQSINEFTRFEAR